MYKQHLHGGDIYRNKYHIDFSANINPLGTPESVVKAACEGVLKSAHYPDISCSKLCTAIAEHEHMKQEWILCGNGAAELIFSLAGAKKPRRALLVSPGFAEYEQALTGVGCQITYYQLEEENGFAIQEDYLEYITQDLDICFLCVPNNPTGVVCNREFLEKVLKRCSEKGVFMVVDECFNDFLEEGGRFTMKDSIADNAGLFILKAFTKIYAMAGLRLGYGLCSNEALLDGMRSVTQPWNVSIPAQMAGIAALGEKRFVEVTQKLIMEERGYLIQELKVLGWKVFDSRANFIFFIGPEYLDEYCKNKGFLIRDCSNYRGLKAGYYRIAVRTHRENEELIEILRELQR